MLGELKRYDIEEFLEYMSLYQKDGKDITNSERGKMRKLSALRSFYNYFYQHDFQNILFDLFFMVIVRIYHCHLFPILSGRCSIAQIVFQERKEENPCSLCAKMRKGALNQAVKEAGCGKVAYAHHRDDVVETMLMSLIYEGRIHTFSPVTYLSDHGGRTTG